MANKKIFEVQINGISESIKDTESLATALERAEKASRGLASSNAEVSESSKKATAGVNDEDRALKQLQQTQQKTRELRTEETKAQIEATNALREKRREVTREIQINQLAEGSIKRIGMELTNMRDQYDRLSTADRESEFGQDLKMRIQALDTEFKGLREETGRFQDSVGNYGKALDGLGGSMESLNKSGQALGNVFLAGAGALSLFGINSDEVNEKTQKVQQALSLLMLVQRAYTAATKAGIVEKTRDLALQKVSIVQTKAETAAKAASTSGTVAATAAQRIFNAVAAMNPYLLLAAALITVVGGLALFIAGTKNASKTQLEALEIDKARSAQLDNEYEKLVRNDRQELANAERELEVAKAENRSLSEIYAIEDKILALRTRINAKGRGFYSQELNDLEKNRSELDRFNKSMEKLLVLKAQGNKKITWDVDLDGKVEEYKVDKAIEIAQGYIDKYNKSVQIAVDFMDEQKDLETDAKRRAAERLQAAREAQKTETDIVRQAEDARIKLIADAGERQRTTINTNYDRQIADIRTRLAQENNLTVKARKALNDQIVSLDKIRAKEIEDLERDARAQVRDLIRQAEDQQTVLVQNEYDRRRAETAINYQREREDLERKLDEDKSLTEASRAAIRRIIKTSYLLELEDLRKIRADELNAQQQADERLLSEIDITLQKAQVAIGKVEVRSRQGLKLIDVDATRQNLEDTNAALAQFVADIRASQLRLKQTHEATLANLKEGTPEYEAEVQRYAIAWVSAENTINQAQDQIADNTDQLATLSTDSLAEFFGNLGEQMQGAADAITAITETFGMLFEVQLEELNVQLDEVSKRYDEVVEKREKSTEQLMKLEEKLQSASGGTADALKQQLADEMANRNELLREEKRIAKEKERLDAQIAKKEKQMKRAELVGNIAMGIANTALGVSSALSLMFPLNLIVAGIVGAMGLVQTGIMTRQLTKLAKGGEIEGPSHSAGGVPIPGTNYEAEGGEFVTNKTSYAANENLVRYINSSDRALTLSDLAGVVPDNPLAAAMVTQGRDDAILSAIERIDFQPQVAVSEIESVQRRMITVRELSGFTQ